MRRNIPNRLLCKEHVKNDSTQQSGNKIKNKNIFKIIQNNLNQMLKTSEELGYLRLKKNYCLLTVNNKAKCYE